MSVKCMSINSDTVESNVTLSQDNQSKKCVILTHAGTDNFKQPHPELSQGGNETIMMSRFTTSH